MTVQTQHSDLYSDLIPVLGITEVEAMRQRLTEERALWTRVDAFFASGFVEGEDLWFHDPVLGRPYKAVYLCERDDGRAGIAVCPPFLRGEWVPVVTSFTQISAHLDDDEAF